jgi:hypothetical protein
MYILIDHLVREIECGTVKRAQEEGNIWSLIRDEAVRFKQNLRATCPEFRACNKGAVKDEDQEAIFTIPLPELLVMDSERCGPSAPAGRRKIIYLDDVFDKRTQ